MSTLPTDYTPLESLLLFQALRVNGVDPTAFARISSDLRKIPLIHNDPSYNAARLAPEALRQLFLDLLKEEAKSNLERQLATDPNGELSPNTRKRKVPSPKMPTVREAAQHSHLIPQLLTRLYVRYREVTVAAIRKHEARHQHLTQLAEGEVFRQSDALPTTSISEIPSSSGVSEVTASTKPKPATKRLSQARIDDMLNRGTMETAKNNAVESRSSSGNNMPTMSDLAGLAATTNGPRRSISGTSVHPSEQEPQRSPSGNRTQPSAGPGSVVYTTPRASSSPRPGLQPPLPHQPQASLDVSLQGNVQSQAQGTSQQIPGQGFPLGPHYYGTDQRTPHRAQDVFTHHPVASRGGVMLPPFQLNSGDPVKSQSYDINQQRQIQQQSRPPFHHQSQQASQHNLLQPGYQAPTTGPRPHHAARSAVQHPLSGLVAALATPPRQVRPTIWKSESRPPPLSAPGSPKRPDVEPLSPLLARAPSPTLPRQRQPAASTRGARRQTAHLDAKHELRSASVESSAQGSEDTFSGRRKIKAEPSTPRVRDSEERDDGTHVTGVATRTRRGTLQAHLQPISGIKRQRQVSAQGTRLDDDEPPVRSNTITATRNFGRVSGVIMNEIVSHKHGSRFAQPVRDSHAEGYSTFIKRPQDLKSIRAAISHGGKAITAATITAEDSPAATTGASTAARSGDPTIELERSTDFMPPKAIVNAAQLEKEVLRMFANAVLFNPGEDGMVADTREMFEGVEAKITEWRGAERDVGSVDDEEEARVKRRKL